MEDQRHGGVDVDRSWTHSPPAVYHDGARVRAEQTRPRRAIRLRDAAYHHAWTGPVRSCRLVVIAYNSVATVLLVQEVMVVQVRSSLYRPGQHYAELKHDPKHFRRDFNEAEHCADDGERQEVAAM